MTEITPLTLYKQRLSQGSLTADSSQLTAVEHLDNLFRQLQASPPTRQQTGVMGFSAFKKRRPHPTIKGIYLWGEVGRGKTLLMDLFYQCPTTKPKLRLHFHRFMARIHREMRDCAGRANPVEQIAKKLAAECQILCFDEFFVADIGDAMLLEQLFLTLFAQGVVLLATSNLPIENLYDVQLHRHKFDKTRSLLKQHTLELQIHGATDYRMHQPHPQQTYFLAVERDFNQLFDTLAVGRQQSTGAIEVCNRAINTIRHCEGLAWFDFADLCKGPRSQLDYIELASRYECIMISDLPSLGGESHNWIKARGTEDGAFGITETGERQVCYARLDDPARRFIALVDELYDQGVTLYLSAQVPLSALYQGGALNFEIKRALSRLVEMQSREYLALKNT